MSWQNPSSRTQTQIQTPPLPLPQILVLLMLPRERSRSLSATFGKVISQSDTEAEAVKSINPAYLPLTDTNRGRISRLTSKLHQGQGLKRLVGARCIQNHVAGACRHQWAESDAEERAGRAKERSWPPFQHQDRAENEAPLLLLEGTSQLVMSYLTAAARLARCSHMGCLSAYINMRDWTGCRADRKRAGTVLVFRKSSYFCQF